MAKEWTGVASLSEVKKKSASRSLVFCWLYIKRSMKYNLNATQPVKQFMFNETNATTYLNP